MRRRLNARSHGERSSAGFTIFELALTLAIMAAITGSVLVPFVAQITQRNVSATEKLLDEAKEALTGFATATGRLPCPAVDGATGNSYGAEAFQPGSSAGDGKCLSEYGYLPAATLGLPNVDNHGFAVDAWGATKEHRIRYAVWQGTGSSAYWFTKNDGMRTATPGVIASAKYYYVCNSGLGVTAGTNCGSAVQITDATPVVIWSPGANAATTGGLSADEAQNPNPSQAGGSSDRIFVSRTHMDVTGSEFDDVVTWMSVGSLVGRMVLGGVLP
jgi:type II secretory pathway pseudopilin PulG